MIITSTRQAKDLVARNLDAVREVEARMGVEAALLPPEDWDDELHGAAGRIGPDGGIDHVEVTINLNQSDARTTDAADKIEALAKKLAARDQPITIQRTGSYIVVGATTGFCGGLLLQEMGKLGQASGNPYISTVAIALTGLGAAGGFFLEQKVLKGSADLGAFKGSLGT